MVVGVIWFLSRVSGSERVSDIIQPQAIKPYHTHNHYVTCLLQYGHLIPYTNQRDLRADFMPRHAIAVRPSGCQYTRASRASKDARLARVY